MKVNEWSVRENITADKFHGAIASSGADGLQAKLQIAKEHRSLKAL
jgi:hypothetical protein